MVSILNVNVSKSFDYLKLLQQRVLLFKETVTKINRTQLNFLKKQVLYQILEICQDCTSMAALPQGAFMACKMREQLHNRDLTLSRIKSAAGDKNESKFYNGNKKLMEYSPVKYNEKLMNSIWGLYNRYSPHNIKSNEIVSEDRRYNQQQQNSAVAYHAIAHNIAMAVTSPKEWTFKEK